MNNGELYLSYNQAQRAAAESVIENFSHYFKWKYDGTDTLLDIGCGPGDVLVDFLLPKVPKNIFKIIGADISIEMIKFAKKHVRNELVSFLLMDISATFWKCRENLKDDETTFDNITSFCCLHWIMDQRLLEI